MDQGAIIDSWHGSDEPAESARSRTSDPIRTRVNAEAGETQILRISRSAPTRIVTPYQRPELIVQAPHETWRGGDGVLYVIPTEGREVLAGFVQDESGEHAIPIVLEPRDIPPQEIILEDPRYAPKTPGDPPAVVHRESQEKELVIDLITKAIHGPIPGFHQQNVEGHQPVYVGTILMRPVSVQTRGDLHVARYRITNEGDSTTNGIHESSFALSGTLGVGFYPPVSEMAPGQSSYVYLVRRRGHE